MSKKVNLYLKKAKKHLEESLKLVSRASHKFDLKDTVKTKEDKEFYDKYMKIIKEVKGDKKLPSNEQKLESFFEQLNKWEDEEEKL